MFYPGMTVPTEVGMIRLEKLDDCFILGFEPWEGDGVSIEWLDAGEIEALGKACLSLCAVAETLTKVGINE